MVALGIGYLFDDLLIAASSYGVAFTNCWALSFNLCVSSKQVESNMIVTFLSAVAHNNMPSTAKSMVVCTLLSWLALGELAWCD